MQLEETTIRRVRALVPKFVRGYYFPNWLDIEDVTQEVLINLLHRKQGCSLSQLVRYAVLDVLRSPCFHYPNKHKDAAYKLRFAKSLDPAAWELPGNLQPGLELRDAYRRLSPEEKVVVGGLIRGTARQFAEEMGYTEGRISQLAKTCRDKLAA